MITQQVELNKLFIRCYLQFARISIEYQPKARPQVPLAPEAAPEATPGPPLAPEAKPL